MADFFSKLLNLPPEEAALNACKMEHIMSEEMFSRISKFSEFIQRYSDENKDFGKKIKELYN